MQERREVELPSGAIMKIQVAPFKDAKNLYQVLLREFKALEFTAKTDHEVLFKNLFCAAFSSVAVEKALWECFKSCTYNTGNGEKKMSEDTFEPVEARDDFTLACWEVGQENIAPFWKSLWREYGLLSRRTEQMAESQKSK